MLSLRQVRVASFSSGTQIPPISWSVRDLNILDISAEGNVLSPEDVSLAVFVLHVACF